jgi:NAD(P)-dependent dehydrogenase (short-subunit alcohol dehydrogenase family)
MVDGKVALVTGGSRGIGHAIARALLKSGARVAITATSEETLQKGADELTSTGNRASLLPIKADVRRHSEVVRAIETVAQHFGGIDVLVNNAALSNFHGDAIETQWDDVEYIMRLNYLSPVKLTRAVLPGMLARGAGHVVSVSSMAARMSSPGESAYSATKAALSAWFEALATEHWSSNVRVHLVYPALIDLTPGLDGDDALAETDNAGDLIPAPVMARAIMRQVERDELELFMPYSARDVVAARQRDLEGSIDMMAKWYQRGAPKTGG